MTHKLKAMGLALVAVFALSAMVAASASASAFHSEASSTIITGSGEGTHTFTASGFSVECTTATFKGTSSGTETSSLEMHPEYSGCESSLGAAPVDTAGCNYVFNATTNGTGHLPSNISCTGTSTIKVTAPGCTLSFGTQNTTGGVKATNLGTGSSRDTTVDATVTASFTKSGSFCFVISGNTGTYTGNTTVVGYANNGGAEGAQVGTWWE